MLRRTSLAALVFVSAIACGNTKSDPTAPSTPAVGTTTSSSAVVVASSAAASEPAPLPKPVCSAIPPEAYALPPLDTKLVSVPTGAIVDEGKSMEPFYARLARLVRGKAKDHVRIAVYGDSNMTMDFITGAMRRTLQAKFGDGGHGFVALARPWAWYRHFDVKMDVQDAGWRKIATSTNQVSDGHYGFANIASESSTGGAWARSMYST
jgi:hypothetical protein